MPDVTTPRAFVGGVPFSVTGLDDAVTWAIARAAQPTHVGLAVRLANAYCVTMANHRPDYLELLRSSGVNLPDGSPVAWTMRRLGQPTAGRVRGPSFFTETLDRGQSAGIRHYFFGTDTHVLADMISRITELYPGAVVVGASAPDFRTDAAELAAQLPLDVTSDSVDIVWVGLGSPKQDFVSDAIAVERGVMTVGVGAAFDFLAGNVQEAPRFIQNSGLEWLFRFVSEPRRLWRRYLLGNAQFLRVVLPQLLHRHGAEAPVSVPVEQTTASALPHQFH